MRGGEARPLRDRRELYVASKPEESNFLLTVEAFDVLGRRVATFADEPLAAGRYTVALDATALAPGVYVLRASAGGEVRTTRLVVR